METENKRSHTAKWTNNIANDTSPYTGVRNVLLFRAIVSAVVSGVQS